MLDSIPTQPNNPTTYTITYNLNSGTNPSGAVTSFNATQLPITLPTPTRNGFNFQGWYESVAFIGNPVTQIPTGTNENKRYFARWSQVFDVRIKYGISYYLDGGTLPLNSVDSFYPEDLPLILPIPVKEGYSFEGWFEDVHKINYKIDSITVGDIGARSLYAKWTKKDYVINYILDGGRLTSGPYFSTLPTPLKTAHEFEGWYEDPNFTIKYNSLPIGGLKSNLTLYAKWSPVLYNIVFNLNGGKLPVNTKNKFSVNDLPLNLPIPTIEGGLFSHWSDSNGNWVKRIESHQYGYGYDGVYNANWFSPFPSVEKYSVWGDMLRGSTMIIYLNFSSNSKKFKSVLIKYENSRYQIINASLSRASASHDFEIKFKVPTSITENTRFNIYEIELTDEFGNKYIYYENNLPPIITNINFLIR